MKGNIFALRFLISYPDIVQYVINTLLLFILFLYWEMLKNVTAAIITHTEEAVGEVPSDGICPVFEGRSMKEEGLALEQEICHFTC